MPFQTPNPAEMTLPPANLLLAATAAARTRLPLLQPAEPRVRACGAFPLSKFSLPIVHFPCAFLHL
jgi:hypothetical protein